MPDAAPERTTVSETPDIAKLLNGYKGKEVDPQTIARELKGRGYRYGSNYAAR